MKRKICRAPAKKRAKRKPAVPVVHDPLFIKPASNGNYAVVMPEHKGAKHTSSSLLVGSREEACFYAKTVAEQLKTTVTPATRAACPEEQFGRKAKR